MLAWSKAERCYIPFISRLAAAAAGVRVRVHGKGGGKREREWEGGVPKRPRAPGEEDWEGFG